MPMFAKGKALPPILIAAAMTALANPSGTWKLNPARSKLPPGATFVGRVMRTANTGGQHFHTTIHDFDSSGRMKHTQSDVVCDGRERAVPGPGAGYSETCEMLADATQRITRKQDGRVSLEITIRLSEGGKVLTQVEKGLRDGRPFDAVLVFDRQ